VTPSQLEIKSLTFASEMAALSTVFQQVWGSVTPLVEAELLTAIAHSGGYVVGAYEAGNLIGASFGFLAQHCGQPALHSHVTGILPGVQLSGIGRAMKLHQRQWAHEAGLKWVTWTFDPLIRRNAWFNIEVLRAEIAEYLINFYGPIDDAINTRDESDRLLAAWSTSELSATDPIAINPTGDLIRVETPEDVVVLRRTQPDEAVRWRQQVRAELGDRMKHGAKVVGFTRDGSYLVEPQHGANLL
jgi:predicted GNAT superfamily acetyltransferase